MVWNSGALRTSAKACLLVTDCIEISATPVECALSMAVSAEIGRYPLVGNAAKLLCKFWNRFVEMDDCRLVKQAFLHSAALGPHTCFNSNHKSWAGQVDLFLPAIGMPCDLSSPSTVSVSAVVGKSSHLASVSACSGVKMQQCLSLIS